MTKEVDVNNCFDSAFLQRIGLQPEADKAMDKDYGCSELQF
jgi:hypothetical protein